MSDSDRSRKLTPIATDHGGAHRIALKLSLEKVSIVLLKLTWPMILFAGYLCQLSIQNILYGSAQSSFEYLGALLSLSLLSTYLIILTCVLRKDFVLSQRGITLPFVYCLAFLGKLSWKWSDLSRVVFSRSSSNVDVADQLVLCFQFMGLKQSVDIHIKFKEIDQLDLKKLMYAIVTNAPHAVIEPVLDKVALEFPTVSGIKHLNFHSFTSLWDEEFSTRYSPTLFVTLPPDAELRNGAIKISELIACGGSAAIYSATDTNGNRIIVKEAVVPKNTSEQLKAKAIELFNREALLLSKLDHPNIAKVFDHFVENDHHYEVLEFIDGLDLRRFVKERGPQPEDFVLNWAQQICEILVYLHSQDPPIIHRDLTPDNLVLRVDGQLVLIDFGAANAFVGTATGTMVGKQSYMPPEQLRGKAVPQSDIYSFGGTCYYLLTGRDPTPLEVSQVDKSSNLSMNLNPLLARCTAMEIADRYDSTVELLQDIRNIRRQRLLGSISDPVHKTI